MVESCFNVYGIRAESVNVEEVIDGLYGSKSDGSLPKSIPLGQMIDILSDLWEGNGLYD